MKKFLLAIATLSSIGLGLSPANADPEAKVVVHDIVIMVVDGRDVTVEKVKEPFDRLPSPGHTTLRVRVSGGGTDCDDTNAEGDFAADGSFDAASTKCGLTVHGDPDFDLSVGYVDVDDDGDSEVATQRGAQAHGTYMDGSTGASEDFTTTGRQHSFFDVFIEND